MFNKRFSRNKEEDQKKSIPSSTPETIQSTPEEIQEKVKEQLPFEVFKKMMTDLSHKPQDKEGNIYMITTSPVAKNIQSMEWYYNVVDKGIHMQVYVSKSSFGNTKKITSGADNRWMTNYLRHNEATVRYNDKTRSMIELGKSGKIIMSPYLIYGDEIGPSYEQPVHLEVGNYFQIKISLGESIKNNYERVIHMLSHLPENFAKIGHDFLPGHEADMGITLDHDVAEDDKMPVIQHNIQKNIHKTLISPSHIQKNGDKQTKTNLQDTMLNDINMKASQIEKALKNSKYDNIASLYVKTAISKEDVILNDNEQQEIDGLLHLFHEKIINKNNAVKLPTGILLKGDPGTGKTSIARMLAHETGVLFQLNSTDFDSKYVSEGEEKLTKILKKINTFAQNNNTHAFIMLDECEGLLSKRDDTNKSKNDITEIFLKFMDGLDSYEHVTFIGATNKAHLIDEGFLRPGRLDKQLHIDKPNEKTLQKLWMRKLKASLQDHPELFVDDIANASTGALKAFLEAEILSLSEKFTGSDIQHIIKEVINNSIKSNNTPIVYNDIITMTEKHAQTK